MTVLIKTKYGEDSIDFSDPHSVKLLNQAILKSSFSIEWDLPDNFLCPPIPGRADYIHYVADLLGKNSKIKVLDIGVGANCIYPILGVSEYNWDFVGSDINADALKVAQKIINANPKLNGKIELRLQKGKSIFQGIIQPEEHFGLTICNPPFHSSQEAAVEGTQRKWKNLGKKLKASVRNFGGISDELWTDGGEKVFIGQMISESAQFQKNCQWFTTLVSKEENLPALKKQLSKLSVKQQVIDISHGNKKGRILCWSFVL